MLIATQRVERPRTNVQYLLRKKKEAKGDSANKSLVLNIVKRIENDYRTVPRQGVYSSIEIQ